MILRDLDFERDAAAQMRRIGFRTPTGYGGHTVFELSPSSLPVVIRKLTAENWFIEAEGKLYRQPGEFQIEVNSGIDWFELHGRVDFGGTDRPACPSCSRPCDAARTSSRWTTAPSACCRRSG